MQITHILEDVKVAFADELQVWHAVELMQVKQWFKVHKIQYPEVFKKYEESHVKHVKLGKISVDQVAEEKIA